jgi:hypothetical protein
MKLNCPKCEHKFEMKNPIAVKAGSATGAVLTDERKAKIGSSSLKYWEAWRKEHGKAKVIRNRPGKPKIVPKRERDDLDEIKKYGRIRKPLDTL